MPSAQRGKPGRETPTSPLAQAVGEIAVVCCAFPKIGQDFGGGRLVVQCGRSTGLSEIMYPIFSED
ncbi:MAG: hypothetical protein N2646_05420 [Bellilinea sp.]|nr:hypothetical protein [Bellilinea sp.]